MPSGGSDPDRRVALALLLVLLVAGAVRVAGIEERPLHHDEALNTVFVEDLWQHGEYAYSPLRFHGPTLAYFTLPFVWTSPAHEYRQTTELTYRIVPLVFGVVLVLLTFALAAGIGRNAALAAATLCALSPAMVFYSRYYVHEMLLAVFTLLAIASGWQLLVRLAAGRDAYGLAIGLGASVGLMHATKETFVIAVAVALLGLVGVAASERTWRPPRGSLAHGAVALGAAAVVSIVLFSSFFTHARGPLDSVTALASYVRQGADGVSPFARPWHWYLGLMLHHEDRGASFSSELVVALLAAVGVVAAALGRGMAASAVPLSRFFAVYTVAMLAIYSAVPYKTPWCILSFLYGMIVLAGVGAAALLRSAPGRRGRALVGAVLFIALAHLAWQAWLLNFRYGADERNPHLFAHTKPEIRTLAATVRRIAKLRDGARRPSLDVFDWQGGNGALYFYLRGVENARFRSPNETATASTALSMFLVDEARRDEVDERVAAAYHVERFELRPGVFGLLYVRHALWNAVASAPRARAADATGHAPRPSFLLVSVDTLRRDHLGAYGYARGTSPSIDALAARGTVFENAVSASSWTLPAHASLLTGRYPSLHGLQDDGQKLRSDVPTLAELLRDAGYRTAAVVSHVYVSSAFGLERGFDVFDDSLIDGGAANPVADAVVERFAARILPELEPPFFAFVHFFDPHWPYEPPEPWRGRFTDPAYDGPIDGSVASLLPYWSEDARLPDADRAQAIALYDGEIAYLDDRIGVLLDALRDAGRLDDTVVLVSADHGEEFEEHGKLGHGRTLFGEQLRVPLVVAGHPAFPPGARRDDLVSIADVAPTILDLAGISAPAGADGRSLRAAAPPDRAVFAESIRFGVEMRSARRGRYKAIDVPSQGVRSFFDLAADPGEHAPLADDPTDGALDDALARYAERADSGWHVKVVALGADRLRVVGRIRTSGSFVAPRHYASQRVGSRAAYWNRFAVVGDDADELAVDLVIANHLAEIVFETEPPDARVTFELVLEDFDRDARLFAGAGVELDADGPLTLSRDDPRLAARVTHYADARPGVYVRTVPRASDDAPPSALTDEAIEQLRALGYTDAGPERVRRDGRP